MGFNCVAADQLLEWSCGSVFPLLGHHTASGWSQAPRLSSVPRKDAVLSASGLPESSSASGYRTEGPVEDTTIDLIKDKTTAMTRGRGWRERGRKRGGRTPRGEEKYRICCHCFSWKGFLAFVFYLFTVRFGNGEQKKCWQECHE